MNTRLSSLVTVALLFVSGCLSAWSQGSTFTYQGRLAGPDGPANGFYDMRFSLFDASASGTQIGNSLTNTAIPTSNGLFAAALDFGTNSFTGPDRWLQIDVRTNGGSSFVPLSPRQQVTPAPYALYASTAGVALTATTAASAIAVAATNISGAVTLAQLPSSVITNNENGINLTGAFNGNGAGLTNVPGAMPTQVVAGTNIQAAPNMVYLLTNNSVVTVLLAPGMNVGDLVKIAGTGTNGWQIAQNPGQSIIASFSGGLNLNWTPRITHSNGWSCDGTKLVAAASGPNISGQIYSSTNSGITWNPLAAAPTEYWTALASSYDGTKLVAATFLDGIFASTNAGATWFAQTNSHTGIGHEVSAIASSADGTKLVAVEGPPLYAASLPGRGGIFTSTDSGQTWTLQLGAPTNSTWTSVASSADGTRLSALASGSFVCYQSIDSGVTWTPSITNSSTEVALSANGTTLVTAGFSGIFTSLDFGGTWNSRALPGNLALLVYRLAVSSDGTILLAAPGPGAALNPIFLSHDSGLTWTAQSSGPANVFGGVLLSANGLKLVAAEIGSWGSSIPTGSGTIWTAQTATTVGTDGWLALQPNTAIELQYVGNGQFLPISFTGGGYSVH
jgi:hypothetical protein